MKENRYIYNNNHFELEDFELSQDLQPNELLVSPLRMLICASDLHHMKAHPKLKLTLGHEYVARIVKAGSNVTLSIGDLITSTACLHCGDCDQCALGMTNYCEKPEWLGFSTKGALSSAFKIREDQVVKLPKDSTLEEASLYEVASIGFEAVRLMSELSENKLKLGFNNLVITGAGPVGIFCALAASKAGYSVTLVEKLPKRIASANELGFKCLSLQEFLIDRSLHHQFDMVIDASGDAHGSGALSLAPHLGKLRFNLLVVGKYHQDAGLSLHELNNFGATIKFMRGTPVASLQSVVDQWQEDIKRLTPKLITQTFNYSDVSKAYDSSKNPDDCLKIMINIQD